MTKRVLTLRGWIDELIERLKEIREAEEHDLSWQFLAKTGDTVSG